VKRWQPYSFHIKYW